tara:strand:+ start:259 stop:588 length:330 start_codon:yes stop_codon:yes gene_type:complete
MASEKKKPKATRRGFVKNDPEKKVIEVAQNIAKDISSKKSSVPVSLETAIPKIEVQVARTTRPETPIRVKAISTVKGVYGTYNYAIKTGEVYSFPPHVAEFLLTQGRVV